MTRFILSSLLGSDAVVPLFGFQRVSLDLEPLSLLTGRLSAGLLARTGTGRARGRLDYRFSGDRDFQLKVEELDLPDFAVAWPQGVSVKGRLLGRVTVIGQGQVLPAGGRGSIRIESGRIDGLKIPGLPPAGLKFDRLVFEFRLGRGLAIVDRLKIEGPQGGLELTGRINDFNNPRLDLMGSAHLGSGEQPSARLRLRLTGPASRPQIKVTSLK